MFIGEAAWILALCLSWSCQVGGRYRNPRKGSLWCSLREAARHGSRYPGRHDAQVYSKCVQENWLHDACDRFCSFRRTIAYAAQKTFFLSMLGAEVCSFCRERRRACTKCDAWFRVRAETLCFLCLLETGSLLAKRPRVHYRDTGLT